MRIKSRQDFDRWLDSITPLVRAHLLRMGVTAPELLAAFPNARLPGDRKRQKLLASVRTRSAIAVLHWQARISDALEKPAEPYALVVMGRELERAVRAFHDSEPRTRSSRLSTEILAHLGDMTAKQAFEYLEDEPEVDGIEVFREADGFTFRRGGKSQTVSDASFGSAISRARRKRS